MIKKIRKIVVLVLKILVSNLLTTLDVTFNIFGMPYLSTFFTFCNFFVNGSIYLQVDEDCPPEKDGVSSTKKGDNFLKRCMIILLIVLATESAPQVMASHLKHNHVIKIVSNKLTPIEAKIRKFIGF